mmetsp:Transcript_84404/g.272828  ORF Transcript_84404/g.272828 Transcript_84404/m.272828 type:complete len:251 (-) Transcript_84404:581-1333(-)
MPPLTSASPPCLCQNLPDQIKPARALLQLLCPTRLGTRRRAAEPRDPRARAVGRRLSRPLRLQSESEPRPRQSARQGRIGRGPRRRKARPEGRFASGRWTPRRALANPHPPAAQPTHRHAPQQRRRTAPAPRWRPPALGRSSPSAPPPPAPWPRARASRGPRWRPCEPRPRHRRGAPRARHRAPRPPSRAGPVPLPRCPGSASPRSRAVPRPSRPRPRRDLRARRPPPLGCQTRCRRKWPPSWRPRRATN